MSDIEKSAFNFDNAGQLMDYLGAGNQGWGWWTTRGPNRWRYHRTTDVASQVAQSGRHVYLAYEDYDQVELQWRGLPMRNGVQLQEIQLAGFNAWYAWAKSGRPWSFALRHNQQREGIVQAGAGVGQTQISLYKHQFDYGGDQGVYEETPIYDTSLNWEIGQRIVIIGGPNRAAGVENTYEVRVIDDITFGANATILGFDVPLVFACAEGDRVRQDGYVPACRLLQPDRNPVQLRDAGNGRYMYDVSVNFIEARFADYPDYPRFLG